VVSTWDWPRVSGKSASLRSRIRGGHVICVVEILPAAQFLTLRLCPSTSTKIGCVDLDGPGHAPPYLCVSPNTMTVYLLMLLTQLCLWGVTRHLKYPRWVGVILFLLNFLGWLLILKYSEYPSGNGLDEFIVAITVTILGFGCLIWVTASGIVENITGKKFKFWNILQVLGMFS